MKKKFENTINYAKIIGIYSAVIATLFLFILSLFLCFKSLSSISYSDDNIDDRYGQLDINTKKVIEEDMIKLMEEKRVNIYFSYVYKDINETYKDSLYTGKNYIFLCYNENSNSFTILSDIEELEKLNIVENGDIKTAFKEAIKSIDKIDKQSKKVFFKSEGSVALVSLSSLILAVIFIVIFLVILDSNGISSILEQSKEEIRKSKVEKLDKKITSKDNLQEEDYDDENTYEEDDENNEDDED